VTGNLVRVLKDQETGRPVAQALSIFDT
jgi:hypothetical protein